MSEVADKWDVFLTRFQARSLASGYPLNSPEQATILAEALHDFTALIQTEVAKAEVVLLKALLVIEDHQSTLGDTRTNLKELLKERSKTAEVESDG